jgi:hypothetical protein
MTGTHGGPPLQPDRYVGTGDDEAHDIVREHYETFFDREGEELTWPHGPHGPAAHRLGAFRVLEIPPNDQTPLWTYASVGAFALGPPEAEPLEFLLLFGHQATERGVELVTTVAYHHHTRGLAPGHRLPLGEPWIEGATCDAFLVSAPHPFGPTLERVRVGARLVRVLWLLPITPAERRFAAQRGLEALEQRFDDAPVEYWQASRPSAVDE